MALLAILLIILSVALWRLRAGMEFPLRNRFALLQWLALGLGVLLFLGAMAVVVPPGQAGVQVLFGNVKSEPMPAGLHFINPFSSVVEFEVRTKNYTMTNVGEEGQKRGDDSIAVITSDGLTVKLDATVFYALQQARLPEILRKIGTDVEEKIVRSEIRASMRDAAANLTATELYTSKRQVFIDSIKKALKVSFESRGVTLEEVLLRNVLLPDQITRAINDKIAADQESQKMAFVLLKEKQEAERKRIEADGQAKAQQIVSQSLTPQILEYQRIQALRAIGEKGNLIISGAAGMTPMIQFPSKKP